MLELSVVMAITLVLAASALPMLMTTLQSYHVAGDARNLASQLALARMRAASDFTQVRLNFNLSSGSYRLQLWDKSTSAFDIIEGGTQNLSSGVQFGYGSIASAPAGTQSAISQPPSVGSPPATSIIFNSRGIPVDGSGTPYTQYVVYLNNGNGLYYAVAVAASGKTTIYQYNGTTWTALD